MPQLISSPKRITAAGNKPKLIDEYIGRVNSASAGVSIAHMRSPEGWEEPAQTPEFDEYTVVLRGTLHVETATADLTVRAGQAIVVRAGERVRYSTLEAGGAEYLAVCLPAFSPETVHREDGEAT
jgi:mannose-6-phosphate isomerase-like protein (cupin superfamily)